MTVAWTARDRFHIGAQIIVRFQVLMVANIKVNVAPCSLIETYRSFGAICCLHHQGDDMQEASASEISVKFWLTTRHSISQDIHLRRSSRSPSTWPSSSSCHYIPLYLILLAFPHLRVLPPFLRPSFLQSNLISLVGRHVFLQTSVDSCCLLLPIRTLNV